MSDYEEGEPVPLPIEDELDLHHFSPKDLKHLIPDYLEACRQKGIYEVRIIHGKGRGVLQKSVHAILGRIDFVDSFKLSDERSGSWGATRVILKKT